MSGLALALSTLLRAPAASASEAAPQILVGVAALGATSGGGLALDGRVRLASGVQLGVGVAGRALRVAYLGGLTAHGVGAGDAHALALFPLLRGKELELALRLATGFSYLRDLGERETPHRTALRSSTELALLAHVRLGRYDLLRAGAIVSLDLETQPTTAVADQMQLLTVGFGRALGPSLLLYANADAGGSYGFDGDNGKAVLRAALGLRMAFGGDARTAF